MTGHTTGHCTDCGHHGRLTEQLAHCGHPVAHTCTKCTRERIGWPRLLECNQCTENRWRNGRWAFDERPEDCLAELARIDAQRRAS